MFFVWQNFVRNKGFFSVTFFVVFIFIFAPSLSALAVTGVPSTMSYQGRLANSAGDLVGGAGAIYSFKFSLWDNATVGAGSQVWPAGAPTAVNATVRQGLFNVNIGDTDNAYPDTLNYDFSQNNKIYLQVEVSSDGSTYETLGPRQPVTNAPFAQVAGQVSGSAVSTVGGLVVNGGVTSTNSTTTGSGYFGTALGLAGEYINQWSDLATYLPTVVGWSTSTDNTNFATLLAGTTTDALTEGLTNKYYSDSLVGAYIISSSSLPSYLNYWTKSGSDLSYSLGKIAIGTSTISAKLQVSGNGELFNVKNNNGTSIFKVIEGDAYPNVFTDRVVFNNTFKTEISGLGVAYWGVNRIDAYSSFFDIQNNSGSLGFKTVGNNQISFTASSTEAMRITGTGLVGIGTTTPSSTLTVQAASGISALNIASSTGASMLTVSANGNIGMGTSSPVAPLHMSVVPAVTNFSNYFLIEKSTNGDDLLSVQSGSSGGGTYVTVGGSNTNTNILRVHGSASTPLVLDSGLGGVDRDTFLAFNRNGLSRWNLGKLANNDFALINSSSSDQYLTVNFTSGNLGIGTTSPISTLSVKGTAGINPFTISSSTDASLFTVLQNGNVGVGTANPTGKLSVSGGYISVDNGQGYRIKTSTGSEPWMLYAGSNDIAQFGSGSWKGLDFATGGNGDIRFLGVGGTTEEMRITSAGLVAIGTTTPASTLTVQAASGISALNIASSTGASMLTITGNGKVGIGMTVPVSKLSVEDEEGIVSVRANLTNQPTIGVGLSSNSISLKRNGGSTFGLDINTGLNSGSWGVAGGYISLSPNSNEALRVLTNGNVGIGTTSPISTLSVKGTAGINPFTISSSTDASLFTVLQNGNVGIGKSNPSYNLEVIGAGGTNTAAIISVKNLDDGAGHPGAQMSLVSSGWGEWGFSVGDPTVSTNRLFYGAGGQTNFRGSNLGTSFNNTSGNALMTILNSGNVGIGTTTPDRKLNVNGNATFGTIAASTPTANPLNVSFGSTYGNSTPGSVDNLKWDLFTSSSSGSRYGIGMSNSLMEFQAGPNGQHAFFVNQGAEAMRILANGLVGIGTSTPVSTLTVQAASGVSALNIASSTGDSMLYVSNNGSVGIGTSNPNGLLQLALAPGGATSFPALSFGDGDSGFFESSDDRIGVILAGTSRWTFNSSNSFGSVNVGGGALGYSGSSSIVPFTYAAGDTNTGVGHAGEDILSFVAGGVNVLNIASSSGAGLVAIGTTTPWAKLAIQNSYGSTGSLFDIATTTSSAFATSSVFYVGANGYVGIGTNAPTNLFEVDVAGVSKVAVNAGGVLIAKSDVVTSLIGDLGNKYQQIIFDQSRGLRFFAGASSANEYMRIDQSGLVGIGSTTPSAKLSILDNSGLAVTNQLFAIASSSAAGTGTTTLISITGNGNLAIGPGARNNSPLQIYNPTANTKYIKMGNILDPSTTANAGGMVVDVNGGGGIFMSDSTNGLYGKYEAYGGKIGIGSMSNHPVGLYANNTERISISAAGLVGLSTTTPNANLNIFGTTNTFLRVASSTNQNIFVVDGNGNVGIGTSSPSANLEVNGDNGIKFTGKGSSAVLRMYDGLGNLALRNGADTDFGVFLAKGINVYGTVSAYGFSSTNQNMTMQPSIYYDTDAGDLYLKGANAFSGATTNINGRDVYLTGGNPVGAGRYGNVLLGYNGTGFVGIGTTTPLSTLVVQATSGVSALNIASSTGASMLTVSANGNVGIGTENPTELLTIGNGGDNALYSTTDLLVTRAGASSLEVRDSTNNQSGYMYVDSSRVEMGSGTNVPVKLMANNTEIMRLLSNGSVGIGTSTPSEVLDVWGNIRVLASTDSKGILGQSATGANIFSFTRQTNDLALAAFSGIGFATGQTAGPTSTYKMFLNSSGNLGIGTSSPTKALEIYNSDPVIQYNRSGSYRWIAGVGGGTTGIPTSYFGFRDDSNSTVPLVIANTTGNVGIGTTSPLAKLDLTGTLGSTLDLFRVSSTTATNIFSNFFRIGANGDVSIGALNSSTYSTTTINNDLVVGNGALTYSSSTGVVSIDNLEMGATSFSTDAGMVSWMDMPLTASTSAGVNVAYTAGLAGNSILSISGVSDGNGDLSSFGVGIGTTSVPAFLTIQNSSTTSNMPLLLFASSSGSTMLSINNAGYLSVGTSSVSSMFNLQSIAGVSALNIASSSGTSMLTVAANGNVGIGTTTPSNRLEVNGSGYFTGSLLSSDISATGALNVRGLSTLSTTTMSFSSTIGDLGGSYMTIENKSVTGLLGSANLPLIRFNSNFPGDSSVGGIDSSLIIVEGSSYDPSLQFGAADFMDTLNIGKILYDTANRKIIVADVTGNGSAYPVSLAVPNGSLSVTGASTSPLATFADDLGSTLQINNVAFGLTLEGHTMALGPAVSVVGVKNSLIIVNSSADSVYEALGTPNTVGLSFADATFATSSDITFEDQLGLLTLRSDNMELDSAGGVKVTDLGNGAVYSNNGILSNTGPSSMTYKDNIISTTLNIDALLGMQVKSFNWKSNGQADFGLIAEEVQSALPEIYRNDGKTIGYLQDHLPFYLLQIAQHQDGEIKNLTDQFSSLFGTSTSLSLATTTAEVSTSTAFSTISDRLFAGVGTVKELVSERMVAMVGLFDYLKAKVVETDTLKVEKGMEIKDAVTGDIYCVVIASGEWVKTKGKCADLPETPAVSAIPVPPAGSVITPDMSSSSSTSTDLTSSSSTPEDVDPVGDTSTITSSSSDSSLITPDSFVPPAVSEPTPTPDTVPIPEPVPVSEPAI